MIAQQARKRVYASDYYVIPRRTGGRKRLAYLYDGRGSVTQTIQTNNGSFADAIRSSKAYSPFGELLTEKVSGYGFNGEYFDAATGMLNLRARQYEPGQGRFSQKDSEKGHVANARSLNAYLYCYNDGVNYFDADGAKPKRCGTIRRLMQATAVRMSRDRQRNRPSRHEKMRQGAQQNRRAGNGSFLPFGGIR